MFGTWYKKLIYSYTYSYTENCGISIASVLKVHQYFTEPSILFHEKYILKQSEESYIGNHSYFDTSSTDVFLFLALQVLRGPTGWSYDPLHSSKV